MRKLSPSRTSTPRMESTIKPRKSYRGGQTDEQTDTPASPIPASDSNSDDHGNESSSSSSSSHVDSKPPEKNDSKIRLLPHKTFNEQLPYVAGLILAIVLCVVGIFMTYIWLPESNFESSPSEEEFSLRPLYSKYTGIVNSIAFEELEASVNLINTSGAPLSFVFAHASSEHLRTSTLALSAEIANMAAKYLGNGNVVTIQWPDKLETRLIDVKADYGELLTDIKTKMTESHVMVVENLQLVPAHLAPIFHVLCDEYTPYVSRSLYLHTIDVGVGTATSAATNRTIVMQRLRQSWPAMPDDVFEPLVTRIAGTIISVG